MIKKSHREQQALLSLDEIMETAFDLRLNLREEASHLSNKELDQAVEYSECICNILEYLKNELT